MLFIPIFLGVMTGIVAGTASATKDFLKEMDEFEKNAENEIETRKQEFNKKMKEFNGISTDTLKKTGVLVEEAKESYEKCDKHGIEIISIPKEEKQEDKEKDTEEEIEKEVPKEQLKTNLN